MVSTVTYADDEEIEKYHLLKKRVDEDTPTREKYKVRIEYDKESKVLPSTDKSYTVEIEIPYTQADDNVKDRTITAVDIISNVSSLVEDGTYAKPYVLK